jgi:phenylalanyl-tRNA synthetase alpha chain
VQPSPSPDSLEQEALAAISAASSTTELREIESKYLGKSGLIIGLTRLIGTLPKEERGGFGARVNEAKNRAQEALDARVDALKGGERATQFERERIDVTLPGRQLRVGNTHVLQQTMDKIKRVLSGLGFQYRESPELEHFKYNFSALNYPPDHPAMDDQDTFYIDDDHLLRTQTTALQGRVFENTKPPLRIFTIGRNY